LRDLVEALRRFEIRVHTAALILGGIAIWAVVTIRDVDKKTDLIQRDVTVLQENAKYIREDIQRIREITDTTKNAVIRVEAILERQTLPSKTPRCASHNLHLARDLKPSENL
jgi:hypothetical protein